MSATQSRISTTLSDSVIKDSNSSRKWRRMNAEHKERERREAITRSSSLKPGHSLLEESEEEEEVKVTA